ncbi:MAG TPA: MarR family transcriptional regulator [Streptosporangiaceae bacterium]|nr:MarR family transcriptional regulator [Streptosporangiaceae bacterium]
MSQEPDAAEVASAVHKSVVFYVRRLRQTPVQDELPDPEMAALAHLDQTGPATPSALARVELITPQAMGVTVSSLVRRGLAERHPDPRDGRLTIVSLTEAGREAVRNKNRARIRQLATALAERFTSEELQALLAAAPLIERLGESLQ